MQLNHSFTVPAPIDHAWGVLRDIERIGPCMPGATIDEVDGDSFTGRVKVKVGPMQVTYKGEASFTEVDHERHRAVIVAKGKEARGNGTAEATVTAELTARGDETEVTVITDLAITGKPAQFGRGVMADVGDKLLGQFADCLSHKLAEEPSEAPAAAAPTPEEGAEAPAAAGTPAFSRMGVDEPRPVKREEAEAINLLDVAGQPVLKRLVPVVVAAAVLWLLIRLVRRGGDSD